MSNRRGKPQRRTRATAAFANHPNATGSAPVEPKTKQGRSGNPAKRAAQEEDEKARTYVGRRVRSRQAQPGEPCAQTHRQVIPTGSVDEYAAMLPPVTVFEADDLDIAKHHHQYTDAHVQSALAFVTRSGIARFMVEHHTEGRDNRGRKETIPFRAVLTALWLLATDGGNLWMTSVRDVLFHEMSPQARAMLGVTYRDRPTRPEDQPRNEPLTRADRDWDEASERTVARTFHRMLDTIDPSVLPKNRNIEWAELDKQKRFLTVGRQQLLQARLDWVCNRLLETAFRCLPRRIRRKYKGSACIDATPLPLYSTGRGIQNAFASADPDGGFYLRDGDHSEAATGKRFWALEVHLIVAVDCHHGNRAYLPALPLSMTTDRPGFDPAGAARRMFAYLNQIKDLPRKWLAGDLLYTDQLPGKFQDPARAAGYQPVLGYGPKHHGRQGTHRTGASMVEGTFTCPAMPEDLVNATVRRRTKGSDGRPLRTHEEWLGDIESREDYLLRTHGKEQDGKQRLGCPASGANPTARCPLKPKSLEERKTRQPDGRVVDVRLTIDPPAHFMGPDGKPLLDVCSQDKITVNYTEGGDESFNRYRQALRFGTGQQRTTYVRLRQAQEGMHGFAKKHAAQALDNPDARLVRGKAAQSLFAALLLAAASIEKIRDFLGTAEIDPNTGDRWVEREPLIMALRTPPGDEAPDPPPEDLPAVA